MVTHLKIEKMRGIREARLNDLGRINVICGRNNSGKSTLLEALTQEDKHFVGHTVDEEDVTKLYMAANIGMGWGSHLKADYALKDIIERVCLGHSLYLDDSARVEANLSNYVSNHPETRGYTQEWVHFRSSFGALFSQLSAVLIPPKRLLPSRVQVSTNQGISPSGEGILNYLFYAWNQAANSSDHEVLQKIQDGFRDITNGYEFRIFLLRDNALELSFSYKNGPWRDADVCGLGLRDLLIILYFALNSKDKQILIEEPENHLHPDMQRKLLFFLRHSTPKRKQFFLTTHSSVFLNNALIDKVYFTHYEDTIVVDDATSKASVLDDLGYDVTDNLVSDLVILVEGPSDIPVLEELLIKSGTYKNYSIKLWPLGGDIMSKVDLSVLVQSYKLLALVDRDDGSANARKQFIKNCETYGIPVHQLERYAIENYFPVRALRKVFGAQIAEDFAEVDPDIKLETQIGMAVKKCSRRIAQQMTVEDIQGTDLDAFLDLVLETCEEG